MDRTMATELEKRELEKRELEKMKTPMGRVFSHRLGGHRLGRHGMTTSSGTENAPQRSPRLKPKAARERLREDTGEPYAIVGLTGAFERGFDCPVEAIYRLRFYAEGHRVVRCGDGVILAFAPRVMAD